MTMAVAVLISTFNAMTHSPALCVMIMKPKDSDGKFSNTFNAAFNAVDKKYTSSLAVLFRHKYVVLLAIIIAIGALAFLLMSTKTGLVPDEDTGTVVVDVQAATRQISTDSQNFTELCYRLRQKDA